MKTLLSSIYLKTRFKLCYQAIVLLLICASCVNTTEKGGKGKKRAYMPESSGTIGDVVLVCKNSVWNGAVGKEIEKLFMVEFKGLPQVEPQFYMIHVTNKDFKNLLRPSRNIFIIDIDPNAEPSITLNKDVYASPQTLVKVIMPSEKRVISAIRKNHQKITKAFTESDISFLQKKQKKAKAKIESFEKMGVTAVVPTNYKIAKEADDFLWYKKEIETGSQNVAFYTLPFPSDEITDIYGWVIDKRDEVLGTHIKGTPPGSHIITERRYSPYFKRVKIKSNNNFYIQTRGLWSMKGDFMGGPFITRFYFDIEKDKVFVAEGFVYAPSKAKKKYVLQLEAILDTFME